MEQEWFGGNVTPDDPFDGSGFPVNGTFDFSDGGHMYVNGGMGRFYFNGRLCNW